MRKVPSSFERLLGARANLPEAIEFEGYKWLVGKPSRQSEYPVNLQDLIRFYPLVVKFANIKDDTVAISLPAETYFEDKLNNEPILNEIRKRIKIETGKDAIILPQGVIALQKVFKDENLYPDKTLVIDGGFNTVNVAITNKEGDILYTKTYYNEFGIRDLLENYFKPELKRKYPETTSNLQKLKEIFLEEQIDAGLVVIDVSNEKRLALQSFIEGMFSRIVKDIERAGESFKQFAIVGGLSYYVPEIETNKPHFIPKQYGEFYTAFGMKIYSGLSAIDFGFGDIKLSEP